MTETAKFFQAVTAGHEERVRALLEAHPSLALVRDSEGATALHHAAFQGHRSIVSLLCSKGADLNARDERFGATPSSWAIHYLHELGGLLAIEIEDVLHAVRTRDAAWARRLLTRHPALVNARDSEGKPLAIYARESGETSIAASFGSSTLGA